MQLRLQHAHSSLATIILIISACLYCQCMCKVIYQSPNVRPVYRHRRGINIPKDYNDPTMTCEKTCLLDSMPADMMSYLNRNLMLDDSYNNKTEGENLVARYCKAAEESRPCMLKCNVQQSHFTSTIDFICRTHVRKFVSSQVCAKRYSATVKFSCQPACGSNASFNTAKLNLQIAHDTNNLAQQRNAMAAICEYAACNLRCETKTMAHLCDQDAADFIRRYAIFSFEQLKQLALSMNLTGDYYPLECERLSNIESLIDQQEAEREKAQQQQQQQQQQRPQHQQQQQQQFHMATTTTTTDATNLPKQPRQVDLDLNMDQNQQMQQDGRTDQRVTSKIVNHHQTLPSSNSYKSKGQDDKAPVVSYNPVNSAHLPHFSNYTSLSVIITAALLLRMQRIQPY